MYQSIESQKQDFCRKLDESYSFDDQVCGLDDLTQGAVVKAVSQEQLLDSGRFKRRELAQRLAEEPSKSMTLYMDTKDLNTSHVLTRDGVYSTSHPPDVVSNGIIFKPLPGSKRALTIKDEIALVQYAA